MKVSNEKFLDEDVKNFIKLLSECLEKKISSSDNLIKISTPSWDSHNSLKSILCEINNNSFVCLKRYDDNFHFANQEVETSKLKQQVGFPYYNVIKKKGLVLRLKKTNKNPDLLYDWEEKYFLLIDFGNYPQSKNLRDLPISKIQNLESFYNFYGKWAAFNYLFGIQDRNSSNFIYFFDTGVMHSVDNEAGPFDWKERNVGVLDIIYRTRKGFRKYMTKEPSKYKEYLKNGFIDGWNQISKNSKNITVLQHESKKLFEKKLGDDPDQIARIFFDYDGPWNKL